MIGDASVPVSLGHTARSVCMGVLAHAKPVTPVGGERSIKKCPSNAPACRDTKALNVGIRSVGDPLDSHVLSKETISGLQR